MLFDAVYSEDVALTVADSSGLTVSSLLLLPYVMRFHGAETKMSYIYGAGTLPRHRMKGHMGRLIRMALHEAAARGAKVFLITSIAEYLENEEVFASVLIPQCSEAFTPLLSVIPLQALAYYTAIACGNDPDKPRNLAKSVTVE